MKLLTLTLLALSCFAQEPTKPTAFKIEVAQLKAWGVPFPPGTTDHVQVWSHGWTRALDERVRVQLDVIMDGSPRSFVEYVAPQDGRVLVIFKFDSLAGVQVVRAIATRVNLGESYSSDGAPAGPL